MSANLSADERAALIAAFRLCEQHGKHKPSVRKATLIVRMLGYKIRDSEAYALLESFKNRAKSGPNFPEEAGRTFDAHGQNFEKPSGRNPAAASRAHGKGTTSYKDQESTTVLSHGDEKESQPVLLAAEEPSKRRRKKKQASPEDIALNASAGSLLGRIAEIRGGDYSAADEKAWHDANMRAAKAWLKDSTADEIATVYAEQCERARESLYLLAEARKRAARAIGLNKLRLQAGGIGAAIDSSFDNSFGVIEVAI